MRVLLTGFEPFGSDSYNASGEAVRLVAGPGVPTEILPVTFDGAPRALRAAISRERPDAVVCVGEAGGRGVITPERWAFNEANARIPDNAGAQPRGVALDDGPMRLGSRIDVDAVVAGLLAAGLPAEASEDAGRYVCNATFRAALTLFDGPAGFVHVPAVRPAGRAGVGAETDARTGAATDLTIEDLARALRVAVGCVNQPRSSASLWRRTPRMPRLGTRRAGAAW